MYTVVISDAAEEMANDAYGWYEEQQGGVGALFLSELQKVFIKLANDPLLYAKRKNEIRGIVIPKFPYIVMFEVFQKEVRIYSIFHTSRRPNKKYRKL